MNTKTQVTVRPAERKDSEAFLSLLNGLAEYESLDPPDAEGRKRLIEDAFGERPRFSVFLAEIDGKPAGYALVFETYSSFLARPKLYLEDLFVDPAFRGYGVGQALIKTCAAEAIKRGCVRMQWTVLDWNTNAMKFYQNLGAEHLKDWLTYNLDEAQLRKIRETTEQTEITEQTEKT
jgi:GNAT superfamily N-acetyltransferase